MDSFTSWRFYHCQLERNHGLRYHSFDKFQLNGKMPKAEAKIWRRHRIYGIDHAAYFFNVWTGVYRHDYRENGHEREKELLKNVLDSRRKYVKLNEERIEKQGEAYAAKR